MRTLFDNAMSIGTILSLHLIAGCATVSTSSEPLVASGPEARIKEVFLFQARVANELLDRYPLADIEMTPALADAEARLVERCGYLNQAAISHIEGGSIGLDLKLKVFASVDGCEAAAHELSNLLASEGGSALATAEAAVP